MSSPAAAFSVSVAVTRPPPQSTLNLSTTKSPGAVAMFTTVHGVNVPFSRFIWNRILEAEYWFATR